MDRSNENNDRVGDVLGLGNISPDLKQRSLGMGAATEKALGAARAAISQDLNLLMLPVFEARDAAPGDGPISGKPEDRPNGKNPPR
jgi:hypothetical protein